MWFVAFNFRIYVFHFYVVSGQLLVVQLNKKTIDLSAKKKIFDSIAQFSDSYSRGRVSSELWLSGGRTFRRLELTKQDDLHGYKDYEL